MNEKQLRDSVASGEDSTRQFKEDVQNGDSLAAEIVAFSNSKGGAILIGVRDDGTVAGLSSADVARINQLISNVASQSVRSPVSPLTENVRVGKDRTVIVLTVPEGIDKPYFDRNGLIWLKSGADKRKIQSKDELRRMIQESGSVYAEEMLTKAQLSALDKNRFKEFFLRTYKTKFPNANHELARLLENLELARNGKLNLAGLLLFAEKPQQFKPLFLTKGVTFPGTSIGATEYLDSEDFEGTLEQQYEGSVAFIMRNLRKEQRGRNVNTTGIPEIPRFVFEELVVNALIHRDYFVNGSIRILVFTDRIEIISPGTLPDNLTIEAIKLGVSVPRNPIMISFIAKGILPYRGLGSGIRRALEGTADITFSNNHETLSFTATIWRKRSTRLATAPTGRGASDLPEVAVTSTSRSTSRSTSQEYQSNEPTIEDRIVEMLRNAPLAIKEISRNLGQIRTSGHLKLVLKKMRDDGRIQYTIPEKPGSRLQQYRLRAD